MDKSSKSMTVSQLISFLQTLKNDFGDREIVLSSDPEGNSFGTLDKEYSLGVDDDSNTFVLYPCEQFTSF